ncbi:MAG: hypothetical protein CL424_02075 [Acidimicrobiaceae bacterium]|nr:hypothetical protein [Acidimicrobiaceae bacterium]
MRAEESWRYFVCVGVGLLLFVLLGPGWSSGFESPFPDSSSYLAVAEIGPFSPDFWFAERPPTYPLLVWLVGPSARAIVLVQTLIWLGAVCYLTVTLWQQLSNRVVRLVTIAAVGAVLIETRWMFWHTLVLTESLSNSLVLAWLAAWIRWFAAPNGRRLAVAVVLTAAWMLLRDSNAVTLTVSLIPLAVAGLLWERRRPGERVAGIVTASVILVLVGAFSAIGQWHTGRGEVTFHNNVGLRWLPDESMRDWMIDRGMPFDEALAERTGGDAWADGEAFLRDPRLEEYRDWASGSGRLAAGWSFVARSPWYLDRFVGELPIHTDSGFAAYDAHGVGEQFPDTVLGPLDPTDSRWSMAIWGLTSIGAVVAAFAVRRWLGVLVTFLVVPIGIDLYLVYVADAIEVGRHLAGPMFRMSIVCIVAVGLTVDAVLARSADRSETPSADDASLIETEPQNDAADGTVTA